MLKLLVIGAIWVVTISSATGLILMTGSHLQGLWHDMEHAPWTQKLFLLGHFCLSLGMVLAMLLILGLLLKEARLIYT